MIRSFQLLLLITTFFIGISEFRETLSTGQNKWNLIEEIDRENVLEYAKKFLGTPYCYACSEPGKGFDCSGFVNFVFKNFNINLPRSSKDFKDLGSALKPEEFKVGDVLVFYGFQDSKNIGHVGIISEANGMNSKFIHASSGKKQGVIISDLGSAAYSKRFYKCINVIP
jgi:cell wall-associated NlpC family hydrolase